MLFTPKLIAINKDDKKHVLNNSGVFGQTVHVIPRANCAFRRYRLKGTGKLAVQAVLLRALNEAHLNHDKFKVFKDPDNKKATVWSYNSKDVSSIRSLPETFCMESISSGCRLVKCLLGVEGQVWDNGILVASRWWNQEPSAEEWVSFIRSTSLEFEYDIFTKPTSEIVTYRNNFPIIGIDKYNFEDVITPKRVGLLASIIALFSLSLVSTKYFHHSTTLSTIEREKTVVSTEANIILSKRRQALANISRIQKYKDVAPGRSFIGALGDLSTIFQDQNVTIRDLNVKDNEIEIRMLGNNNARVPELVAKLEKTHSLMNVSITTDRQNSLLIKAQLTNNKSKSINAFQESRQ